MIAAGVTGHEHRVAASDEAGDVPQVDLRRKAAFIHRGRVARFLDGFVRLVADDDDAPEVLEEGLPEGPVAVKQKATRDADGFDVRVIAGMSFVTKRLPFVRQSNNLSTRLGRAGAGGWVSTESQRGRALSSTGRLR